MPEYDVIVIGAGNAGLSAATALQRGGVRTLLLERHNVPGGCATSFVRGRFEFEVALHQLSGVGSESQRHTLRDLLRHLGVADKLELVQEHELYRTVVPGVLDITLPADRDATVAVLEQAFPGSKASVERFLDLCRDVTLQSGDAMRQLAQPGGLAAARERAATYFRYAMRSTKDVLDEFFTDQRLKFVLASYWGYIGQPPSRLPFAQMAAVIFVYLEFKPFHIRGGSQALSTALLDSFYAAGGVARFNCGASRILVRNGAAAGVRTETGEEISCAAVVSNASSITTYTDLLDRECVPPAIRRDFRSRRIGPSAFVIYMGLDASPAELGFTASTNLVSLGLDEDWLFAAARTLEPARTVCATCYDIAPIGFAPPGACHVSLLTLQYSDPWEKLEPAQYAAAKFRYAETLLDVLAHIAPTVRDVIEEAAVATPLTVMHYLGHPGGSIYGFDQDATDAWPVRSSQSHVPGLYLAGAWTTSGGFQPTLEAGARVARRIIRGSRAPTEAAHA
jgi:prolycopene isomerase